MFFLDDYFTDAFELGLYSMCKPLVLEVVDENLYFLVLLLSYWT